MESVQGFSSRAHAPQKEIQPTVASFDIPEAFFPSHFLHPFTFYIFYGQLKPLKNHLKELLNCIARTPLQHMWPVQARGALGLI